jgi:monofunctional biosynthetic peptidoglycan transglycosylase
MASEDARFCEHRGVDWRALDAVIDEAGGPTRGASTIAMQVARNLFLWTPRSYVRKGLEIPLALYGDLVWGKHRQMEIYLNIAQWGPNIFGIEAAARTYFARAAKDLTAAQAALLAVSLPNPIIRNPANPSQGVRALARRIAARARQMGAYDACLYP